MNLTLFSSKFDIKTPRIMDQLRTKMRSNIGATNTNTPTPNLLLVLEQKKKTQLNISFTFVGITIAFSICNKSFKPLGQPSRRVRSHEGLHNIYPQISKKKEK